MGKLLDETPSPITTALILNMFNSKDMPIYEVKKVKVASHEDTMSMRSLLKANYIHTLRNHTKESGCKY